MRVLLSRHVSTRITPEGFRKRTILRPLVIALASLACRGFSAPGGGRGTGAIQILTLRPSTKHRSRAACSDDPKNSQASHAVRRETADPVDSTSTGQPAQDAVIDPAAGFSVKLSLSTKLPPRVVAADTPWVKRTKIQSKMRTS